MRSTEYVTTEGDLIETAIGGMLILRREPEHVAKSLRSPFDAMRAGIVPVKVRLGNRRRITLLRLRASGIERSNLLIDDECQTWRRGGKGKAAVHIVSLRAAKAPKNPLALPLKLGPGRKEIAKFLEPSPFAQSDAPEIIRAARRIVGNTTDSWAAARLIQAWVFRNVKKKGLAALSNALAVLRRMEGDCSEHSILFVALCRAAGIPTRQIFGIGYSDEMKGFGYHAWAEVYVGKWVAMDPTWGEDLADATHVKFGVGGTDSFGTIAGLFGSLKLEVLDVKRK